MVTPTPSSVNTASGGAVDSAPTASNSGGVLPASRAEPLTPVQIEGKLRQLVTQITQAQQALAATRDRETGTEIELKRQRIRFGMDPACPAPARGSVTVAQREEWIEGHCFDAWAEHRQATTLREIAQDALRAVLAVSETAQSLNASVRQAYAQAGRS